MSVALPADPYGIHAAVDAAAHPKPFYRFKAFWVVLGILALVIGVRLALDPLAARYSQKGFDSFTGYDGSFTKVRVSLLPPAYTIEGLKLQQEGHEGSEPVVYVKHLTGRVILRDLLKLRVVATVTAANAKVAVKAGATKVPPEGKEAAEKLEKEVEQHDLDLGEMLHKIIPLRANRIEVRDSELVITDVTEPKVPALWVSDVQLAIENLVTRRQLDQNVPLNLTMRAVVAKTGTLKVMATGDLLADKPAFSGQAQLSNLQLQSLWAWTEAKAGVGASGTLNAFVNFNSAEGKVSGDAKVIIRDPQVGPATDKMGDSMKAKLANMAISVLANKEDGRKTIGTTLPVKGTLTEPSPQLWPAILGVVRNAFVDSIEWGFSDLPTPTSSEKGPFKQAVEALDKKNDAPKAQPR